MAENIAECHFCGKGFSSAASRNRHIKGVHQNIRPFKCSVCDKAFTQKVHRDMHKCISVHHNVSGKKAYKPRNHQSMKGRLGVKLPKQSSKKHSTPRLALFNRKNVAARTCDVCHTVFSFRTCMTRHRKVHFERKNDEVKKTQISRGHPEASLETGGKQTCDICQRVFFYRYVMLRHRRGHFSEKDASSGTQHKAKYAHKRGEFSCDICQMVFSFKTSMARHRKVHFQEDDGSKKRSHIDRGYVDNMAKGLHSSKDNNPAEGDGSLVDPVNLNKEEKSSSDKGAEPSVVTPRNESESDVTCDICCKTYSSVSNMQRHRKTHSNPRRTNLRKITWRQMHLGAQKTEIHQEKHVLPKLILMNDQNVSGEGSDSKMENESETQHIIDEDEREKIDKMMQSTVATQCLICHSKFTRYSGLKLHVEGIHLKLRRYKCKFCVYTTNQKGHLVRHVQHQHSSMSTVQPFHYQRIASKDKNGRHWNWHSARGLQKKTARQSRTCPICFKIFANAPNALRHKKQMHASELDNSVRKNELLQDSSDDPVIEYETLPNLINRKHTREDRTCEVCHKVFHYRKEMLIHKARVHPSDSAQGESPHGKKPNKRRQYFRHGKKRHTRQERTCDVCEKVFPYRCEMLRHRSYHPAGKVNAMENDVAENDPPPIKVETPLKYPTEMSQDERERIKEMLKADYTGTKCTICYKNLNKWRFLVSHINVVHLKLKPYKCIHCRRTFALMCNLKVHLKNVHRDTQAASGSIQDSEPPTKKVPVKNIECDICKKLFITNFSMLRHKRTHTSDKILPTRVPLNLHDGKNTRRDTQTSFECEEDKSHMSNTSASKKYKCKKCNRLFLSRSLLVRHHHAYHVRRWQYDCSQCGKQFTLRHHLASHTRKVHGRAPTLDNHTKPDNDHAISDIVERSLSKNSTMSAPPKPPLDPIRIENTEVKAQSWLNSTSSGSAVEFLSSRRRNSSGSSHSSWSPSVGSSPSVKSSHSLSSMHSASSSPPCGSLMDMKVYRCTMCRCIFTNSDDWREHLSQHLGGGTKMIYLASTDCNSIKCEDGEQPAENTWSYICPSCKVEVQGSFNLVMHIKGHMT